MEFEESWDQSRSCVEVVRFCGGSPVKTIRTMFGAKTRPHRNRAGGPPRLEAVIETPSYDLTMFKVHFGRLTFKAYTKGEHVLRVEAIVHNTRALVVDGFSSASPTSVARRHGRAVSPPWTASMSGSSPTTCSTNSLRHRNSAPSTSVASTSTRPVSATSWPPSAPWRSPPGSPFREFTTKVRAQTGQDATDYSTRQGAYDLRKIRAKGLIDKPGRTRRYQVPPDAAAHHTALASSVIRGQPHPRRRAESTPRPQARHLDRRRPRLRNNPHRHADPLYRPGIVQGSPRRGIDNVLSILLRKPLDRFASP